MSEDFAPVTDIESDYTEYDGTTEVGDSQAEDIPVLSVDEYADYRVPVKLDGEELKVPLSEAIAGYQRQADYTRKTQELADQRQQLQFATALQAALENDPASTIDMLASHYGISRAEARDMVDGMDSQYEDFDPATAKMRELDQRIARFEELENQQQVEREIARLESKYEDFDINEVVVAAIQAGTTDLEGVYKQMAFDRIMNQVELQRQASAHQQAEEQRVMELKRQAAIIDGGSSATANTTTDSFEPITNIRDAWAAAKRQYGA